ncbi:ribosomal protein L11 methyltransferase isoform X2 [Rhodamnia argentea]|uniref:ETFB lysine methyltransferase n=1 Tax=Rhodamnia argentea TaxID=178133 RepID=A0ABM3H0J7_9MYRT|nr:ribosomal protein L11 methyltransferase isoform X2 [Rhodamnia argentea]
MSVVSRFVKHLDVLSEALLCFGASSASMDEEDGSESPDEISINSIFLPSEDVDASVSNAADSIGLKDVPVYDIEVCEQEDWVTKTQESFHPVEVTEGLWIVPEWKTPPIIEATNIILNPGLAFGTGEHPTTRLCLLLLHDLIKGGEHLLDYGTGSGILAIAALKLGAAAAVGFDVDPQAISSARHNAALNNIGSDKMQLELVPSKLCPQTTNEGIDKDPGQTLDKQGLISATEKYDVVVANILLNPLLEWADHIVSYAKPGATVAVSGILSDQLPLIRSRYSRFLEDILVSELDDWACLSGRKR